MQSGPCGDTPEDLDRQFDHSCSLGVALVSEAATDCHHGIGTRDCCIGDEPQDGGGEGKRAAGSSQTNSAAHAGRSSCSSVVDEGSISQSG